MNQKGVKFYLDYNQETGIFTWARDHGPVKKGAKAGTTIKGNNVICLHRKRYMSSKLAWLYVYGYFPDKHIMHKNKIGTDDRIKNLYLRHRGGKIDKYIKTRFADVLYNFYDHMWEVKNVGRFRTKFDALKARMVNRYGRNTRMGQTRHPEMA